MSLWYAGIEHGFRFVLDFECFNHLDHAQRKAVGREVSAVAARDATMLMRGLELRTAMATAARRKSRGHRGRLPGMEIVFGTGRPW